MVLRLELNHPIRHPIISVYIVLKCSAFIYLLDPLYQPILVPVGVVVNNPFSPVDVGDLLPAVGLPWGVVVHCGELEGVSDSEVELILAVLVVVLDLLDDVPQEILIGCYAFNQPIDLELVLVVGFSVDIDLGFDIELGFFAEGGA